jgi:hypothetical protein
MALGFVPVIIAIFLSRYLAQNPSVYIATAVGIIYTMYTASRQHVFHLLLYFCTVVMIIFSLISLIFPRLISPAYFPFVLELVIMLPVSWVFLLRNRLTPGDKAAGSELGRNISYFAQGMLSTIVSLRVAMWFTLFHLAAIILFEITQSVTPTVQYVLFRFCPLAVFVLSIVFNQIGIAYFNRLMRQASYLPVVDDEGCVTGKINLMTAFKEKTEYMVPVIRIAIVYNNMLYLRSRSEEEREIDLPIEEYMLYKESIEQRIKYMMGDHYPMLSPKGIQFINKQRCNTCTTDRLNYLFLLRIDDETKLETTGPRKSTLTGKLWTFQQIEQNLHKDFFARIFEDEYQTLKESILKGNTLHTDKESTPNENKEEKTA